MRSLVAAVFAACLLASPVAAQTPAGTAEARDLPEGVEARSLPEGRESRELPGPAGAEAPEEAARGSSAPAALDPEAEALRPAPLDDPVPADAGEDPAFWQDRRNTAQASLARVRAELRATEEGFTRACRYKGGNECDRLRARAQALRDAEAALEDYLREGLAEECRRHGCLPGWVRG